MKSIFYNKKQYFGSDTMYKYYKELENPEAYKIYLRKIKWRLSSNSTITQDLSLEFVKKHCDLFYKLKELDKLILGHNEKFDFPLFMEGNKQGILWGFYAYLEKLQQDREEYGSEEINLITNTSDLFEKLREYDVYCNYFIDLYPNLANYFKDIQSLIQNALKESKVSVTLPPENEIVEYQMPNAWFLTPNGFLYNPDGKIGDAYKGHKGGNLHAAYNYVESLFEKNEPIPETSYNEEINLIMERGYVLEAQFQSYANLCYQFPSILTKDIINTLEYGRNIWKMEEENRQSFKRIDLPNHEHLSIKTDVSQNLKIEINFSKLSRSYQPKILQLYIGLLQAIDSLNASFRILNTSNHKKELLEKIYGFSWDSEEKYLNTLIRFNGFHKVESSERKITTSSLNGVELFKAYLEKGWDLYIVPPIMYDSHFDDVVEFDFSLAINYFDKILNQYQGKGRVLVKDINC